MAANIKKYVECIGEKETIKRFFLWFYGLLAYKDDETIVFRHDLTEYADHVIDYIGTERMPNGAYKLEFWDTTPYGNMTSLLGYMRRSFPSVTITCYNERDEVNEED